MMMNPRPRNPDLSNALTPIYKIYSPKMAHSSRSYWEKAQDKLLCETVKELGRGSWLSVSRSVPGKTAHQCRERWMNKHRPEIKRSPLTDTEINFIHQTQLTIGNRWTEIAKCLPGRTPNQIKNYWYSNNRYENKDDCYRPSKKRKRSTIDKWSPKKKSKPDSLATSEEESDSHQIAIFLSTLISSGDSQQI